MQIHQEAQLDQPIQLRIKLLHDLPQIFHHKLQKFVSLSTTKGEYIGIIEACKEILRMMWFFRQMAKNQKLYTMYYIDQSAIHWSRNPGVHSKSNNIDLRCNNMGHP